MSLVLRRDDPRIWRLYGDPLVSAQTHGPLSGLSVAAKDVFQIAGQQTGFGNPYFLEQAPVNFQHARVVQQLLDAGVTIQGIAHSDEFAYSLDGINAHYGKAPNPYAADRLAGGSSSGSASAVGWGFADVGLGTDTGGSIRIPAAYQGLYGIRPSHGAVSVDGVIPMATSFDSVGWMTRSPEVLKRVGDILLPQSSPVGSPRFVTVSELTRFANTDVREPLSQLTYGLDAKSVDWPGVTLDELSDFVILQAFEVWQSHRDWLEGNLHHLGDDVRERFEMAAMIRADDAKAAEENLNEVRERLIDWLGDRILIMPTAPTLAPRFSDDLSAVRGQIQRLACVAGIGRMPAVTIPLRAQEDLWAGACLVAAPGQDRALLDLVFELKNQN